LSAALAELEALLVAVVVEGQSSTRLACSEKAKFAPAVHAAPRG
jgi:hypothetical protein